MDMKFFLIKGIIFVSVTGTIFHFLYDLTGNNIFFGLITPVNESIWEHTKLIFFPMLIYSFNIKKIKAEYPCIDSALIIGEITGIISIIVLFYTYTGIIGFNVAFADISIFYISVLVSFYTAYRTAVSCKFSKYKAVLIFVQIIIIFMYVFFTFYPPGIPLFINHFVKVLQHVNHL